MAAEAEDSCDVAVIGAGISGLTAAALLSRAGLRVTVVESEAAIGGCIAGFQRKGFLFDTGIHWLNECGPDGFIHRLFSDLDPGYPKCRPLARIRRIKSASFDYLLTSEPDALRDRLCRDFPEAAGGVRSLFAIGRKIAESVHQLSRGLRCWETMSLLEYGLYGLRMGYWSLPLFRHVGVPAEKGLRLLFRDSPVKDVFASEEEMMGVLVPLGWAYAKNFQMPPAGGSRAFALWLQKRIEASGSRVLLRHRVAKVLLEGGVAAGVVLAGGRTLRSRFVLAACDVEALYERMLPPGAVPTDLLRRLHDADLYDSGFMVNMGLDCGAAALGFGEEMLTLFREDIPLSERVSGDPAKVNLCVMSSSVRDASVAPAGKGTLSIFCRARIDYMDHWRTGPGLERGPAYAAFKKEYADALIARVERVMSLRLREHIEALDIATPVTYWRYTGNRDGSIMGARPTMKNIKSKIAHFRTPVKNLLLAGHWADYGGGIPIAVKAAANTALLILKDTVPAAYQGLRDLMDGKNTRAR